MHIDKDNWKETDINVDSLWVIGPRAKGGKHENVYHGNFVPQIPNQMIRRYTDEGDTVLEMFMGSGTTLFECESLNRNYIGFDINEEIINFVKKKMEGVKNIHFHIHNCNICDTNTINNFIHVDLKNIGKRTVDHIIIHPPYLDIIKFTDNPEDLSNLTNVNIFIEKFIKGVSNCWSWLKVGKYISLIIGDIYRNGEVIPLGFYLMYAIKKHFSTKLKGIIIKDMVGNRGKLGNESLWRYRTLQSDTFLFKHEYLFVFKKESPQLKLDKIV